MSHLRRFTPSLLVLTLLVPSLAQAGSSGSRIWGALTYVSPLSESDQNVGGVTAAVKASKEMGYQIGAEFRSGMLGIAVDWTRATHDLSHESEGLLGTTDFKPLSATLALHLPTPLLDLYAGPTISWVNWSDLELPAGGKVELDATLGYGITAGAELPLGPSLGLGASLRWLRLDASPSSGGSDVAVDPLLSNLSISLHF